jgi:hypothetical protein
VATHGIQWSWVWHIYIYIHGYIPNTQSSLEEAETCVVESQSPQRNTLNSISLSENQTRSSPSATQWN